MNPMMTIGSAVKDSAGGKKRAGMNIFRGAQQQELEFIIQAAYHQRGSSIWMRYYNTPLRHY